MLFTSFKECRNGMFGAFCATISFTTYFINHKCNGYYELPKPIKVGDMEKIHILYTDENNDLRCITKDNEGNLQHGYMNHPAFAEALYEIVKFFADCEEIFS